MSALTKVFERQPIPANELGQIPAKLIGKARRAAPKTQRGS
jgi:hypothetical protein